MNKRLAPFVLLLFLSACASTEDIAFKATGVTAVTANAAMSEWLDYKNTHTVPPEQVQSVKDAWDKYYLATRAERAAVVSYKTNPGTNTLNNAISMAQAASSDLIVLIMKFLPAANAAKIAGK